MLAEEAEPDLVARVTYGGYLPNPTDDELLKIGRDPFLVSYVLKEEKRCIVTTEVSKPNRLGANRKIPDVCRGFNIRCINNFQMFRELKFTTSWKNT